MKALLFHYPVPALLAALLLGMILKWLLDLFFLRSRLFGLERLVNERERDLTESRHEHGRVLTDLKNRLTELDATQKAKLVMSGTLAARELELGETRRRLAATGTELELAREGLEQTVRHREQTADLLRQSGVEVGALSGELITRTAELTDTRLRLAQAEAEVLTARDAARQWQKSFQLREAELGLAGERLGNLERELAAAASVYETVQAALQTRDAQLAKAADREGMAALEAELATVSASHARLEHELSDARAEVVRLETPVQEQPGGLAEVPKDSLVEALHGDLDQLTRERNELAAELAALRVEGPPPLAKGRER